VHFFDSRKTKRVLDLSVVVRVAVWRRKRVRKSSQTRLNYCSWGVHFFDSRKTKRVLDLSVVVHFAVWRRRKVSGTFSIQKNEKGEGPPRRRVLRGLETDICVCVRACAQVSLLGDLSLNSKKKVKTQQ
jgi:hypothetical protein